MDNGKEEQDPDNGGRPKGNFRIAWARPEQRARSCVGRKGYGYTDGGAQENVARIMDAEIHTTEAEQQGPNKHSYRESPNPKIQGRERGQGEGV